MANTSPVSLSTAVSAYLEAIATVRTENVVANHVSMSKRFLAYFSVRRPVQTLAELRPADLYAFLNWLTHRRGRFTDHTYNLGVEFARRLTRFAMAKEWLEEDPAVEIAYLRIETAVPVVLSREELARLIDAAGGDDLNRILVGLLGEVGLKKQELVALRFADLELDEPPMVAVRYAGKLARKSRRLPLPGELAQALRRYSARRQAEGSYGLLEPLVPITGRQVNNIVVSLCQQAGVRRANPQILRDTAAVQLLLAGRPPEEVGRQLGYTPRGYLLEFLPRFQTWMKPQE
jgi:site-specific recombinase XerD